MHREISHADQRFEQESRLSLYLLTAIIGLLLAADIGPVLTRWLNSFGLALPIWSNEVYGYRLALFAAVVGGARALYGSLDALFEGRVGADLALAIACVAAILLREPLVAAEIVFIGLIGECLESITFERTQRAIRRLVEIVPRRCWRLRDGQPEMALVGDLRAGDLVLVKPGKRVPADGVVRDGRSALDVSALTGESLPVDKGPGDEVLCGSFNQFGALTVEVVRAGEQTVAGRVIELTSRALQDKSPVERAADRLARWFLPAVLTLAALTFLVALAGAIWFRPIAAGRLGLFEASRLAAYPALAVLVVACPCALILATPAAVIAALGRLAGTGILIKGGSALERLASVSAVAFDKTGTLTEGKLELVQIVPLAGVTEEEVLRVASLAEQSSEHPLARLVVEEAARRNLPLTPVDEFLAHPGSGVTARTAEGTLIVGNQRLLQEQQVAFDDEAMALLNSLDRQGQTVLIVAQAGKVLGMIGARDRIRSDAAAVLGELRGLGITDQALLTGDRATVARQVGEEVGLAVVHAGMLPQEKADFVAAWQQSGKQVAMVGDGINDAPALARANVGLAIGGTGSDLAAEAGDIVFMGDPLRPLPLLLRLSRATVRIIRQNILVFAFGVNLVGIVLTAWLWPLLAPPGWYEQSPVAAVLYHQFGSIAVLLNSMRLLWFEREASPGWQRLSGRLQRLNDWIEGWLDLDEGLHWLSHRWREATSALLVLLLVGWGLSGVRIIGPDEQGLIRRFGRLLLENLEPGLHWRWPWPIETLDRVQPRRIRTLEIGFRAENGQAIQGPRAWSSQHGGDGIRRLADEAVMMTGDGNLIEVQATLRFAIENPRTYFFEVNDAPALLRDATEAVLRELTASRTFTDLLTTGRQQFAEFALARLRERCDSLGPNGLGIRLDGLALHDLHPPQEVVDSYHEVTKAMEARDRRVNLARAAALGRERRQESASLRVVREAEAQAADSTRRAAAQRDAFLERLAARSQLSMNTELDLLLDAAGDLAAEVPPASAAADYQRRRAARQARQQSVNDFRLLWDALASALAGREKVIVDADRVPGRRHLWLLPPELLRGAAGVTTSERGARPSRGATVDEP